MLKIFIVSLKRDEEKRQIIKTKLDSLRLSFEFVDAVDGRQLPETKLHGLDFSEKINIRNFPPTPGEIGCGLSHLQIYEKFNHLKDEWFCVLEDDAILDQRFAKFIHHFDVEKVTNYRDCLLVLGGQNGLSSKRLISRSVFNFFSIGGLFFRKVIDSERHVYRTCCYLINRRVAENLLKLSKKYFFLADDWVFFQKNKVFRNIYIADFVDHPLDLTQSAIEQERSSLKAAATSTKKESKALAFIKYSIKVILAKLKSFTV
jgi:GR25 family glycosyltransferase involved in LPS biosynthesis